MEYVMKLFNRNTKDSIGSVEGHLSPLSPVDEQSQLKISFLPDEATCNGDRFAAIIENVLSPNECKLWIQETERAGYGDALVNIGNGKQKKILGVRNSSRCIIDSEERANELWNKISTLIPKNLYPKWTPVGLNERLRFLRYDIGEYFAQHSDGSYVRTNDHPCYGDRSMLTFQLYLNDDFEGGTTRFYDTNSDYYYDVIPKAGSVLIFEHPLVHSGETVTRGRKYALRSDIMYTLNK